MLYGVFKSRNWRILELQATGVGQVCALFIPDRLLDGTRVWMAMGRPLRLFFSSVELLGIGLAN